MATEPQGALVLPGDSARAVIAKGGRRRRSSAASAGRGGDAGGAASWVAPYVAAWGEASPGAQMPIGPNLRPLRELEAAHGRAETLRRFGIMLRRDSVRFASGALLQRAWGEYATDAGPGVRARVADRATVAAERLFRFLTERGILSCAPVILGGRLAELQRGGALRDLDGFARLLRRLDFDTLRHARERRWAVKHITDAIGDDLPELLAGIISESTEGVTT